MMSGTVPMRRPVASSMRLGEDVVVQGCVDLLDDGPLDQGVLIEGTQSFVIGLARCGDDGGCADGGCWGW
jgi:hypothetical protein